MNHTKKTIVNFLLRKNLTIDFVKNVQKKQEYDGLYYGTVSVKSGLCFLFKMKNGIQYHGKSQSSHSMTNG